MKKIVLFFCIAICYLTSFSQETGTFTDSRDGKVYKTVKIGNQWWMAENLAYIPTNGNYWFSNYCYYYDWESSLNACPVGWHLPKKDEWAVLFNTLGNDNLYKLLIDGGSSGFNAYLKGYYHIILGYVAYNGCYANFWSSTSYSNEDAWSFDMYKDGSCRVIYGNKKSGYTIRCLKD